MNLPIITPSHDGMYHGNYLGGIVASAGTPYWGGLAKSEGESDVCRHRSKLICSVLKNPAFTNTSHFLLIDADMGWTAKDFARFATLDPALDVVGGVYVKKNGSGAVVARDDGGAKEEHPADRNLVTTDRIGFGFIRLSRRVLEFAVEKGQKASAGWSLAFPSGFIGDIYESEDYLFCHRVINAGYKVWMDRATRLTHRGFKEYVA
jgi:hypothetical protein